MNPPTNKFVLLSALLLSLSGLAHAEKADRDKPMHIEADHMNLDDAKRVSTFEGKVEITQGTLRFTAEKLVVTEDAAGHKFCVASGHPASFRQKRDIVDEYVEGYGERIEYNTQTETVNLYEQARVKREQDEVQGNHITYSTQTGVFRVNGSPESGRAHATIQPKNKDTQSNPGK